MNVSIIKYIIKLFLETTCNLIYSLPYTHISSQKHTRVSSWLTATALFRHQHRLGLSIVAHHTVIPAAVYGVHLQQQELVLDLLRHIPALVNPHHCISDMHRAKGCYPQQGAFTLRVVGANVTDLQRRPCVTRQPHVVKGITAGRQGTREDWGRWGELSWEEWMS